MSNDETSQVDQGPITTSQWRDQWEARKKLVEDRWSLTSRYHNPDYPLRQRDVWEGILALIKNSLDLADLVPRQLKQLAKEIRILKEAKELPTAGEPSHSAAVTFTYTIDRIANMLDTGSLAQAQAAADLLRVEIDDFPTD